MPKVSVIIPVYNCAKYAGEAIQSVLAQTYGDFEIIVIDDGSTDYLKTVLSRYAGKIRYLYQENTGVSYARNTGIKEASGEYIAFLDGDDMWLPKKLELQVQAFDTDPSIGLVHSDINALTTKGEMITALRKDFSEELVRKHSGNIFDIFFTREIYISCPTVVARKECFEKVGLFNKDLARLGFEDFDMWLRILRHYEAYYIHKPLAIYRIRPNSMSKNRAKMIKAHKYVIEELSNQFKLPEELRRKATIAMLKEWGLRQYMFPGYAREIFRTVRNKLELIYE